MTDAGDRLEEAIGNHVQHQETMRETAEQIRAEREAAESSSGAPPLVPAEASAYSPQT